MNIQNPEQRNIVRVSEHTTTLYTRVKILDTIMFPSPLVMKPHLQQELHLNLSIDVNTQLSYYMSPKQLKK